MRLRQLIITEPVALWGSITALVQAVIGLGLAFGWWAWTDDQVAAILLVLAALGAIAIPAVRGRVSPTAHLDGEVS